MKTVLILHGVMGYAGVHWQKWLHDELLKHGYYVLMPDLPNPEHPDRSTWLSSIKSLTDHVSFPQLTIVGHSLGVASGLDVVEDRGVKIEKFVSVSGFGDDYGAELNSYFMKEKTIDFRKINQLIGKNYVVYGDNDPYVPQTTLRKLAKDLHVEPIVIPGGGHLNSESKFTTFPLLLDLILENK